MTRVHSLTIPGSFRDSELDSRRDFTGAEVPPPEEYAEFLDAYATALE